MHLVSAFGTKSCAVWAYLYIDGKQADVIGGDGIMITQPLSENSIGE